MEVARAPPHAEMTFLSVRKVRTPLLPPLLPSSWTPS